MTATRARLRGIYALLAGALLLLVVPFYQGQILAPTGYGPATDAIARHGNFAPLVAWLTANLDIDRGLRLIELLAYLLILPLSGALAWAFWDRTTRARLATVWCGWVGVLCVLLGGVAGFFTSGASAGAYASASTAAGRASAVSGFMTSYAIETLLAQALGGLLLAVMIGLVSVQIVRQQVLYPLIGYFGVLVAAVMAGNAILFALGPLQAQTVVTPVAYAAIALWLLAVGLPLARTIVVPIPDEEATATDASDASDAAPARPREAPQETTGA